MADTYPRWGEARGPVSCSGCKQLIGPGQDIWVKSKGVYYCAVCGAVAEASPDEVKARGIEEALLRDLEAFPGEAADTTLAKSALYMARALDCGEVAPREVTQYTKEIRLNLLQIRDLYPPADDGDDTEDRQQKLQERRRREQGGI
jgi:hypothetical protein